MKTTELISKLQAAVVEHGDIPIVIMDDQWPESLSHAEVWPLNGSEDMGSWDFPRDKSGDSISIDVMVLGRKGYL